MSLISIDIRCSDPECNHIWDTLVERDQQDLGVDCPICGVFGFKTFSAPNVLRASHPDGYSKGPGYQAIKEAARLKSARANMPNTDSARADINKEIRAVEKAAGRGYVKKEKHQK